MTRISLIEFQFRSEIETNVICVEITLLHTDVYTQADRQSLIDRQNQAATFIYASLV
jgi:hypothetical protein